MYESFFENGELSTKGEYYDNYKYGNWTYYRLNGKLQMTEEYDKEEFEKRFIKMFNNEGILKSSGMRYFNRDIGVWSYYEDNNLIKTKGRD